jgi:O-methyltransferase
LRIVALRPSELSRPAKRFARRWLERRGYVVETPAGIVRRMNQAAAVTTADFWLPIPVDVDPARVETIERVRPFTVTSPENVASLCAAVEYLVAHEVPGGIVECGVWKGGSMMAAALTLLRLGATDRDLYLSDTFTGMTPPTDVDEDFGGRPATEYMPESGTGGAAVPLHEVRAALESTGYPPSACTTSSDASRTRSRHRPPKSIALLRLDTDWYESTRHGLIHLYPPLVVGGVLLIDDYGAFRGARKAADEYLAGHRLLLQRVDFTARLAIKQHP